MRLLLTAVILFSFQITTARSSQFKPDYFLKFKWLDNKIYSDIILYTTKYNLDPKLVCSLYHRESKGKIKAIGKAGEIGIGQVKPVHYPEGSAKDLFNPTKNIMASCRYLNQCKTKARGDINTTLRYYNAGCNNKLENYKNWQYISDIRILMEI